MDLRRFVSAAGESNPTLPVGGKEEALAVKLTIELFHGLLLTSAARQDEMLTLLRAIKAQGERMHQELIDLAAKIDEATNAVAARIDRLSARIKNSMTDEEVAQVKAALGAEVARLTDLGKDPNNPVPPQTLK